MATQEFIEDKCNQWRRVAKDVESEVRAIVGDLPTGEAKAQAMLAVRHLEDARMRLGKVIQHSGDGVSCYDKTRPEVSPDKVGEQG